MAADDPDLQVELEALMGPEHTRELYERFWRELDIRDGAMAGLLGVGAGRVNIYTVRKAGQGLALWLRRIREQRPVAIAYDSRYKSERFAREMARVLAANGVFVWLFPREVPAAALSFTVRRLHCGAGVCVTGEHHAPEHNGLLLYGSDGARLDAAVSAALSAKMAALDVFEDVLLADFKLAVDVGMIRYVRNETMDAFVETIHGHTTQPLIPRESIAVVYSPLNGVGLDCVGRIMERAGVRDFYVVKEQARPNGAFPTCPAPDPNAPGALAMGVRLARQTDADLVLATDPPCGKVGAAVRHRGDYFVLTGNELGILLFDYICRRRISSGQMPVRPVAVKTLVATDMARQIAEKYGVELIEVAEATLIGGKIGELEQMGMASSYIFGFEESGSFLAGSYVREGDGVGACMLLCEMVRDYKSRGITLVQAMEQLWQRHGCYVNRAYSVPCSGLWDMRTPIPLKKLRQNPPQTLGGVRVSRARDYLAADAEQGRREQQPPVLIDMLEYSLENGARVVVRPGPGPAIQLYVETVDTLIDKAQDDNDDIAQAMRGLLGVEDDEGAAWEKARNWGTPWYAKCSAEYERDAAHAQPEEPEDDVQPYAAEKPVVSPALEALIRSYRVTSAGAEAPAADVVYRL